LAEQKEINRYLNFLIQGDFDVMINYAAQSWCSDLAFENIGRIKAKKILIPCGYSGLKDPRYWGYFRWLPKVLKDYDSLVYLSDTYQDIVYHRKHQLKNAIMIPNGADETEFLAPVSVDVRKKYGISSKYLAICVSNFFILKGQDFVIRAFNKMKTQDVTLVLIGSQKFPPYFRFISWLARKNKHIKFLESIPRAETIDFYKQSDFFLFGSRVECSPLVMFESFAARTLFLTRNVGNTAEYRDYGVLVGTPKEMSRKIDFYVANPGLLEAQVDKAHLKYLKDHTYEVLAKKYEDLILSL